MKLTESKLKKAPASKYMNTDQLDFFKEKLISQKIELSKHLDNVRKELSKQTRECDELDRAQIEEEMHLKLRILDRESKLLPKIDEALKRIDDGSYGYCVNTGEPIGIKRLEARPVATLSLEAQEMHEKKEKKIN